MTVDLPDFMSDAQAFLAGFTGATTQLAALIATGSATGSPGGAPLLNFSKPIIAQSSAFTVPVGTPKVYTGILLTGVGYDGEISLWSSFTAQAKIEIQFIDTSSGALIDDVVMYLAPGTAANPHTFLVRGPSAANELAMRITAIGNSVTFTAAISENSRVYTEHKAKSVSFPATLSGGLSIVTNDVQALILAGDLQSVAGGAGNVTQWLPMFTGRVSVSGRTTSNAGDMFMTISAQADNTALGSSDVLELKSAANGIIGPVITYLPRSQCVLYIENDNAAVQTLRVLITALDTT